MSILALFCSVDALWPWFGQRVSATCSCQDNTSAGERRGNPLRVGTTDWLTVRCW